MNDTATASAASTRIRTLLASLTSLLLIVTGLVVAQPALAAGTATVTASVSSASAAGLSVRVQASGLPAEATGAYVAVIETGTESGVTGGGGYAAMQWVRSVTDGALTVGLDAAAASLDRAKTYEVLVWAQHSNPDASTIYGRGGIGVTDAQWDAVFGAVEEPGTEQPGTEQPGTGEPGTGEPGTGEPGTEPGTGEPGTGEPGTEQPASASIEVFLADGVTPASGAKLKTGDTVVVKGSGYDPAANVGGRGVPIPSNLPQGTYVVFGNFADTWQPSKGAASAARSVGSQTWALAESVLDQVPSQFQSAIRAQWVDIADDGTFQATLTLKDTPATPGTYGVYTYPAGGVVNADQERAVALDYTVAPRITVTAAVSAGASGISATVAGTNFGAATGVYAAIIETGTESGVTGGGGYAAMQWVRGVAGGAFSVVLDAPAEKLDRTETYEVLVWRQHSNPDASTILARAAVPITDADWDAISPEPASPSIDVFLADGVTSAEGVALKAGDTVVVRGSGYDPAANVGGRGVPIPANLPQGTYVVFGNFAETWQPSKGAASSARSVGSQVWALAEDVLDQVPAPFQSAIRAQWVDIAEDGTFEATLTLKDTPATPGSYGVYTYAAGGVVNADQEQSVTLDYGVAATMTATVASATAADGLTVTASGDRFGDVTGAYVALIEAGTESELTASGGFFAMQWVRTISDGSFSVDLTAAAADLDRSKTYEVLAWRQHSLPTADTIYARASVMITPEQWTALLPGEPTEPTEPTTPTTPTETVPGGSLRWAISSSFVNYITGPIAQGAIEVSGGATRSGGQFQFGQAVGSTYDRATGLGTVSYVGAVRFTGHHGVLDVTISSPQIRITSASQATLYVTSGGAQVPFATLDLSRAATIAANGAVTYSAAPAALTSAGRDRVLQGYSTDLNPVTFTIGSAAAAPAGSTGTVAAASVAKKAPLPATPPTSAGIEIDDENLAALQAGKTATVSASGFQPNETGISVVVYSTPVLLDTVTADASGVASWTGSMPASLADGEHTLTLQGSVDRGLTFTLTRETAVLGACTIDGATLNWGFKESFRTYIEGIAKGGWTLTDVEYSYPDFVWSGGAGSYDDESATGLVTYGGSIAFSGHDGALNTTVSAVRLELAGDTGYIVVDVAGTTQAGESVDAKGVRFAEFALDGVAPVDGVLTIDDAPATLTDAGAAAFGTYAAGEELDPVSATIPVGAECGAAAPVDDEEEGSAAANGVTALADTSDGEGAPVWPWIVGGLIVVLAAAGGVLVARRSRAKDEAAETAGA